MNEHDLIESQIQRVRNMSEGTSGNESDVGYRKTTRLTSEQLVRGWERNKWSYGEKWVSEINNAFFQQAKLNLNDGANSVHFSVTTKYQVTEIYVIDW